MTYIDPQLIKRATLQSTDATSLAVRVDEYSGTKLLCRGDVGVHEVLLDTDAVGCGGVVQEHEIDRAWIIDGVRVEVDPASIQEISNKIPLSVVRQGGFTGVFYRGYGRIPQQTLIAPLSGTYNASEASERVAFGRWRVVHGSGRDMIVLIVVDTGLDEFKVKPQR